MMNLHHLWNLPWVSLSLNGNQQTIGSELIVEFDCNYNDDPTYLPVGEVIYINQETQEVTIQLYPSEDISYEILESSTEDAHKNRWKAEEENSSQNPLTPTKLTGTVPPRSTIQPTQTPQPTQQKPNQH